SVKVHPVSVSPLAIRGRYKTEDGTTWLAVTWQQPDGTWKTELANRRDVMSAGRLTNLASSGFPVTSKNASLISEFFTLFEKANHELIPVGRITNHLGWQNKNQEYLWGKTLIAATGRISVEKDSVDTAKGGLLFRGDGPGAEQLVSG